MTQFEQIGTVAFVQVQRDRMKAQQGNQRVYRPDPLLRVESLLLTADGISGIKADGETVQDVHHAAHPNSRYRGDNAVSFGFMLNYRRMQQRFGSHIADGAGGENIVIACDRVPDLRDFTGGVCLEHVEDGNLIQLANVSVAAPCVEFSTYCLQHKPDAATLKETLQFLDHGTRGFYATVVEQSGQCLVSAGDRVLLRASVR